MTRILVAMEREAKALGLPCEVIGIGADKLPPTADDDVIVNVGYCGGDGIPVGAVVEPKASIDWETQWTYRLEKHFPCRKAICVTAPDFVNEPLVGSPAVYDMELSRLIQLPCRDFYCLKIVSDNLNETDCEGFNDGKAWEQVRKLLKGAGLI